MLKKESTLLLHNTFSLLEKVTTQCVVFLDEQHMKVSAITSGEDAMAYLELNTDILFSEMRIESQSNNSIMFELNVHSATKALSSCKAGNACELKLAKRNNHPCLCFNTKTMEIEVDFEIQIRVCFFLFFLFACLCFLSFFCR